MAKRILVVEDDDSIRSTIQELLAAEGYTVKLAPNGKEAIEILERDKPHLVVLDLIMPVMDGAQFLSYMRTNGKLESIPVFVVTAAAEKYVEIALPPGIKYIHKPFDLDIFLAHVRDLAS